MKINLKKISALIVSFLSLFVFLFASVNFSNATTATLLSDTMTRQQVSVASSHTISLKLSAAETLATGETIIFDFGIPGFTLAAAVVADANLNDGTNRGAPVAAGTAPACSAGVNNWTLTTNTGTGVVTVTTCASWTASAANPTVTLQFGTAAGGTNRLTNPGTNGSKKIAVTGTYGDAATSFAVPILNLDQVTVTASVDPSITSSVSPTSCPMNATLTTTSTGFCAVTNTVSTNASSGYVSTVADLDATNPGKLCSPSPATCTNNIPAGTTMTQGTSAFGVNTSKATQTVTTTTPSCGNNNSQATTTLTGTAKQYSSSTGPVSADAPILCYQATISGTQAAGSYSEVSTHITTGTF